MTRRLASRGIALRAFVALVVLWLIAPILTVIPLSLSGEASFVFPPKTYSLRWFENLFSDPAWRDALLTSVKIAGLVVVLSSVLGTACALGLDRGRIPGKTIVQGLVLAPMIVPVVVIGVGVYAVFLPWHLIGTTVGFTLAHTMLAIPFVVIAVTTSLSSVDRQLEQAAASLGASALTAFRTVTLPLILPGVCAGAVFAFITSFDELVVALFLSTPFTRTVPVRMYDSLEVIDPTIAAASTVLLIVTTAVMLLAMLFNRNLRDGSATG